MERHLGQDGAFEFAIPAAAVQFLQERQPGIIVRQLGHGFQGCASYQPWRWRTVFVLDSVAFLTRRHPQGELLTVPGVEPELVNRRSREYHAQLAAAGMQVAVADAPSQELVAAAAQETGDAGVLSPVDSQLLALALERDATLITDDFAMQNVAASLGIAWLPVETDGIAKQLRWRWSCSGCQQRWDEPHGECPTCGSELRRTRR